ncbi:MAG: hypothetical protein IJB70_09205 [Clostridia bacterium]|nr:hypothetical protein [Clostridia bacterium]
MSKIKGILSVILCLTLMLSFAACTGKDNGETTETQSVSQTDELTTKSHRPANKKEDDDSGNLLITLYNADSDEYHALKGKIETIDTGIDGEYGMTGFRFVSPKNGVKVRLEGIMWSPIVDNFECDYTYLEITTEKDKIYEFDCCVTETIPDFRLVAEYDGKISEYYMSMDGESVKNVIEMTGEEFVPEEITEESAFYSLCVAHAVSDVYYNDRLVKCSPEVVWNTFAYAVTLNDAVLNGEDMYKTISVTDWEADAYMNALYPHFNGKHPDLLEESYVEGSMGQYDRYNVTPWVFERFCTNEFYGVEDNGDGTYSVKIRVDDYRYEEGYEEFGLAVIVKPDTNNPFGYVITDVVDCDLPVG